MLLNYDGACTHDDHKVIDSRIDRRCLYHKEDPKIKANDKVPNKRLQSKIKASYKAPNKQFHHDDRRSLVPRLCRYVIWYVGGSLLAVVAVVACLITTPIYSINRAGSDPAENAT